MRKNKNDIWGLFNKKSHKPVPLKCLNVSIKIVHNVARVLYTQVFYNNLEGNLEVEFFFPISPEACFDSFEAKFQDTVIKGVVKEKEEAKQEYKEAINRGDMAAYAEINEETQDVMKVMIGNIPSNTEVSITYSYIEKLEVSLNKFWCFRLFSCITPRYIGNLADYLSQDILVLSSYPTISSQSSQAYPWTIKAEIQSPAPITFLNSPSHELVTSYGNENHTCEISLNPNKTYYPKKDFVLLYSNGKESVSDYVLTPFEDGYCAMVTLLPGKDSKVSLEDQYEKAAKVKSTEEKETPTLNTVRGEYIFLIDRSGSMTGERIVMAKKSLTLFLKSLPTQSCFNIISFGSNFNLMFKQSTETSRGSLEDALKKVNRFQADLGGTNISEAFEEIFKTPIEKGFPRFIFLLTDGAVSDTSKILELIEQNREKARIFTIGIGNGCSPKLITNAALNGGGKHEFVPNASEIQAKVMNLLNASLSPCYFDFKLEGDNFDALVKSISPNPASVPFLLDNQPATFFLFLREEAFQDGKTMPIKLTYFDSKTKLNKTIEVSLDKNQAFEDEFIPKLALHDMIRRYENDLETNPEKKKIIWWEKAEIKKSLLELSLRYGILCKATAFFCKIASKNQENEQLERAHVRVPSILSEDYDRDFGGGVSYFSADISLKQYDKKKAAGCCDAGFGGGGSDYDDSETEEKILKSIPKEQRLCFDVITKQSFEGSWDPNDKELAFLILRNGSLSKVPQEKGIISNTIWITILVLLWLEIACENQKAVWKLIYQKGKEWLKDQGVDYDSVKSIGKPFVKD